MDTTAIVGVIGTVSGAVIGAGTSLASARLNARGEQRAAELASRRQTYRSVSRALSRYSDVVQSLLEAGSRIFPPRREELDHLIREAQTAHAALGEPLADLVVDGPYLLYHKANSATDYLFHAWSSIRIWPPFTEEDEHRNRQMGQEARERALKDLGWAAFEVGLFDQGVSQVLGHDREVPPVLLSDFDKAEMDAAAEADHQK